MTKRAIQLIYWTLVALFVITCTQVNLVGLIGYHGGSNPFAAFDELYSAGEVYNILTAEGFKELLLSIVAGQGYIYGRFVYICDSIIAFIPYQIFGLKGLVFSVRMAHALYLIFGFHLINRFINKEVSLARIFSLLLFIPFPVTIYFIGMPKPEPLQLLLIGLFFTYKRNTWSWLFLGLALGTKISIAFGCLFLAGMLFYQLYKKEISTKRFASNSIFGLIGLFIALPSIPMAVVSSYFRQGLINIVTTASKPYDNPDITFADWVVKLLDYYYTLPFALSTMLVVIILLSALIIAYKKPFYRPYVVFAFLSIIPIMIFTKRLWGHYLFFGLALMLPFVFHLLQNQIRVKKYHYVFSLIVLLLFSFNIKSHYDSVKSAIERNSLVEYKEGKTATLNALVYCQQNYPSRSIGIDIELYYQYQWALSKNEDMPMTITFDNFSETECVITPINKKYPEKDPAYRLRHRTDKVNIWVRQ